MPALLPLTVIAVSLSVFAPAAEAQYPARPIRFIVPFPPGGGVDIVARTVGEKLGARVGQPVVVENRPGAGTTIGNEIAARSTPDGYTLLVGPIGGAAIAQAYYPKLRYDIRRDFAPVTKIGHGTIVLVVAPSLGVASVKELVALAKARPGQLTFGSSGTGALIHLTGELFKQTAGVDILHVPYKGTANLLPDLIDGRVSMALDSMPAHLPHIRAARLRALAVASPQRSSQLPDVPTLSEAGLSGLNASPSYALYAPARTPSEIIAVLNRETNAVLQQTDVRTKLLAQGIDTSGSTPEALRAELLGEYEKWSKVIRTAISRLSKRGVQPYCARQSVGLFVWPPSAT